MNKNYYVYVYLNPTKEYSDDLFDIIKNEPFYIGRGQAKRCMEHILESKKFKNAPFNIIKKYRLNMLKINTINKIIDLGKFPIVIKLYENLSLLESKHIESTLIKKYGKIWNSTGILTNITDGGEGCSKIHAGPLNPFYGHKVSEKNKKLTSLRFKGKTLTQEHKTKISLSLKNKNKSHSAKEKYRESMRRRYIDNPNQKMFRVLGLSKQKTYELQTPLGTTIIVTSLRAFCLENGLNAKTIKSAYLKGSEVKSGPSKGWKIIKELQ